MPPSFGVFHLVFVGPEFEKSVQKTLIKQPILGDIYLVYAKSRDCIVIFVNDFDWLLHFHDLSPGVRVVLTPLAAPHKGLNLNGAIATKQPSFYIALPEDELDKMLLDLLLSHQVLP